MKTYLKTLCLLMVGIALIFGSCSKKKSTEPTTPATSSLSFTTNPTAEPSGLVVNQDTSVIIRVGIAPNSKLLESSVRLLKVNSQNQLIETLNTLYDDGDLTHGDEIIGDGIFSTKQHFHETSAGTVYLRIKATTAETGGNADAYTPAFTVTAVANISDETFNANVAVQDEGSNKFDSLKSALGDETQAKIQTLNWVKGQSGVSSADTTEQGDAITVHYSSGIKGFILLYTDDDTKGSSSVSSRQKNPTVHPSLQTRGTLDLVRTRLAYSEANDDTIGGTSVLIYDAFHQQFPVEGDNADSLFMKPKCPKFTVTYLKDAECTVEKVKTFSQYGTIYISTHGNVGDGQVYFLTGEVATQDSKDNYVIELTINEIGLGTVKGQTYFTILPLFITLETGTFGKSMVFTSSCYSANNETMSDAFRNKGVLTYFGFSLSVHSSFAKPCATGIFDKMINQQKKTGEAFTPGQTDPKPPSAEFKMYGSANARYVSDFVNGDFETGSLQGWNREGDGRVISHLVFIDPSQGSFMGIISTGLGFTTSSGSISQGICIPAGKTTLSFKYNFLSEEFMKYCGDVFQDYFEVSIDSGDGSATLFSKRIDDLCGDVTEAEGIHFDQPPPDPEDPNETEDGVWMTGWTTVTIDISDYAGKSVTVTFACGDVGDSVFDTAVLLDEIKFQ